MDPTVYFLVRRDLGMGKGKISAQCGHALTGVLHRSWQDPVTRAFCSTQRDRRIITLKVESLDQLKQVQAELSQLKTPTYLQVDAGLTQIPENTPTVLAVGPTTDPRVTERIRGLKLY